MASASGRSRNSVRLPAQIVIPAKGGNPFESGLVDSGSALRYGRNDDLVDRAPLFKIIGTDASPRGVTATGGGEHGNLVLGMSMKVMAIGTLKPLTPEQRQKYLSDEVAATLKLYVDGKMEQFWLRDNNAGVIFLMTVDSVAEADALLKALPLGQANLLTFELMPIGPLTPLGMLIK